MKNKTDREVVEDKTEIIHNNQQDTRAGEVSIVYRLNNYFICKVLDLPKVDYGKNYQIKFKTNVNEKTNKLYNQDDFQHDNKS